MTDPEIIQALTDALEKKPTRFNDWEQGFIDTISGLKYLSDRRREIAQNILSEKSSSTTDKAAAREDQWAAAKGCVRCTEGIVVMRRGFTNTDRSTICDYSDVPMPMQFVECAFPCVCERGVLKKEWQRYRRNALEASDDGWATRARLADDV